MNYPKRSTVIGWALVLTVVALFAWFIIAAVRDPGVTITVHERVLPGHVVVLAAKCEGTWLSTCEGKSGRMGNHVADRVVDACEKNGDRTIRDMKQLNSTSAVVYCGGKR